MWVSFLLIALGIGIGGLLVCWACQSTLREAESRCDQWREWMIVADEKMTGHYAIRSTVEHSLTEMTNDRDHWKECADAWAEANEGVTKELHALKQSHETTITGLNARLLESSSLIQQKSKVVAEQIAIIDKQEAKISELVADVKRMLAAIDSNGRFQRAVRDALANLEKEASYASRPESKVFACESNDRPMVTPFHSGF